LRNNVIWSLFTSFFSRGFLNFLVAEEAFKRRIAQAFLWSLHPKRDIDLEIEGDSWKEEAQDSYFFSY